MMSKIPMIYYTHFVRNLNGLCKKRTVHLKHECVDNIFVVVYDNSYRIRIHTKIRIIVPGIKGINNVSQN
jgi:hypothetical protein